MNITAYRQAAVKAVRWLLSHQNEDGSINPVDQGIAAYYKVPYAFSLAGRTPEAVRLLTWVRENAFTEEGDYSGRYPRVGAHQVYYHYANSWLICGAQRLGQFDLSMRGVDFLLSMQHPESGGFLTRGPESALSGEQDLMSTCMAGMACLYTGRTEEAARVGDHLGRIWEKQPTASKRLYFTMHQGEQLITNFPEDDAVLRVVDATKPAQHYVIPGLATAFLVRLWYATGERKYLQTAHEYAEFGDLCGEDRYTTLPSGWFGWGAALLYQATGNANYQRIASTVADFLVENQLETGTWGDPEIVAPEDMHIIVDSTAELAILICEVVEGLMTGE
ncbi:MAG: terpene cyclase/mutase family protein [Armatimonadetes bacterium]|nr:terpene cyclase/mutase family protein [Armatimonadota bacterium]